MSTGRTSVKAGKRAERGQRMKAAAHPIRAKALAMMAENAVSPKEIAATLNKPVANVAYHVRELERAGLIELVEKKQRRGATEHFYSFTMTMEEDLDGLSNPARELLANLVLNLVIGDAALAAEASTLGRPDEHLSRVPLLVDEQGWNEIRDIFDEALLQTMEAHERSSKRLEEGDAVGLYALAALLLFEMPEPNGSDGAP